MISGLALPTLASDMSYSESAQQIRQTYESQLYTLSAFKEGHYGLRMYRQTLDPKYKAAIWSDLARVASTLNRISSELTSEEQIKQYSIKRISGYIGKEDERSLRRFNATIKNPEYVFAGVTLLGSMARADEYGLKHQKDDLLRKIIRQHDYLSYVTDPEMIRAWAAQLANQVYWLRQLGEQDVVEPFTEAFKAAYPDELDHQLTHQQFGNKIYGMTHIIFADSGYYRHRVKEQNHQWIYDYLRKNIDTILANAKEDVIAEVGISFLLAGLDNDPVVEKTRQHIQNAINEEHGMVPSVVGDTDLEYGEHRNVLAIMLLDWRGPNDAPTATQQPKIVSDLPYGLVAK
ncbi:DUF3541 domain-containing protein [Vibrio sp. SCSIO 43136]|uniref:DUF3541 domain-containing protein n=1 Tax=Vibrio sp. SCSIO 43136 TaxID=2819101 RepID=UPI002075E187|nr:DUF3541 domain-containing protein [Vibrio sp. SCSIO 43136]